MARNKIPDFVGWAKSNYGDNEDPPEHIKELVKETRVFVQKNKRKYTKRIRAGVTGDRRSDRNPVGFVRTHIFGPFDLPLSFFTSSRWNERRTNIPVPMDEESWRTCWEFWKSAYSYIDIKAHCERYAMRRAILADYVVNFDPEANHLMHRCFCMFDKLPDWPQLILKTGNERLMMAMFEWGWKTIPTCIVVRDCGYNPMVTELLHWLDEKAVLHGFSGSKEVWRPTTEVGGPDGYLPREDVPDATEAVKPSVPRAERSTKVLPESFKGIPGRE